MDVKQAIITAKHHIADLFEGEGLVNLGLEEIRFKDSNNRWEITLGFSRPWNASRNAMSALTGEALPKRTYKVVVLKDESGEVVEIRNRETEDAQ